MREPQMSELQTLVSYLPHCLVFRNHEVQWVLFSKYGNDRYRPQYSKRQRPARGRGPHRAPVSALTVAGGSPAGFAGSALSVLMGQEPALLRAALPFPGAGSGGGAGRVGRPPSLTACLPPHAGLRAGASSPPSWRTGTTRRPTSPTCPITTWCPSRRTFWTEAPPGLPAPKETHVSNSRESGRGSSAPDASGALPARVCIPGRAPSSLDRPQVPARRPGARTGHPALPQGGTRPPSPTCPP